MFPITKEELNIIPILLKTRLAASVIMSNHTILKYPGDDYLLIDARPAAATLELLSTPDKDEAMAHAFAAVVVTGAE